MARTPRRSIGTFGRRFGREAGFSLVELLVALVVFGIILAAIYAVWFGLQRTYAFTEDDMRAQQEARNAMGEMVELIRTARQPSSPPDSAMRATILRADATELLFWSDADRDSAHDLELVQFRVATDGETWMLYRDTWQNPTWPLGTVSDSTRLVSRWVGNSDTKPLFFYEDAMGVPCACQIGTTILTDPMDIRKITITLRVDLYTEEAPVAHILTSVVQPRNLR